MHGNRPHTQMVHVTRHVFQFQIYSNGPCVFVAALYSFSTIYQTDENVFVSDTQNEFFFLFVQNNLTSPLLRTLFGRLHTAFVLVCQVFWRSFNFRLCENVHNFYVCYLLSCEFVCYYIICFVLLSLWIVSASFSLLFVDKTHKRLHSTSCSSCARAMLQRGDTQSNGIHFQLSPT